MATGTVKWFSVARKYGFIAPDDGGKDVFVHMSALITAGIPYLDDGTEVTFDFDEAAPRRNARNLALVPVPVPPRAPAPTVTEPVAGPHE
jgi:CspA family cold shock protein